MTKSPKSSARSHPEIDLAGYFRAHESVVSESIEALSAPAEAAGRTIIKALKSGGKIIAFGNGGSATQASHLAGELVGRFRAKRQPLPALSLSSDGTAMTCIANDFGYSAVFDRQIAAFARPGDVAIGLTTSGKSENVLSALVVARARNAATIALTGSAGLAGGIADHVIAVPSEVTAHIQEVHLMVLHLWCIAIDEEFGRP